MEEIDVLSYDWTAFYVKISLFLLKYPPKGGLILKKNEFYFSARIDKIPSQMKENHALT